jgi:hypothetical protein
MINGQETGDSIDKKKLEVISKDELLKENTCIGETPCEGDSVFIHNFYKYIGTVKRVFGGSIFEIKVENKNGDTYKAENLQYFGRQYVFEEMKETSDD